jgi:hypothetical protein
MSCPRLGTAAHPNRADQYPNSGETVVGIVVGMRPWTRGIELGRFRYPITVSEGAPEGIRTPNLLIRTDTRTLDAVSLTCTDVTSWAVERWTWGRIGGAEAARTRRLTARQTTAGRPGGVPALRRTCDLADTPTTLSSLRRRVWIKLDGARLYEPASVDQRHVRVLRSAALSHKVWCRRPSHAVVKHGPARLHFALQAATVMTVVTRP